ncbi:hypothetical protein ACOSQ4_030716 [Xanthoceras sorbifolium]
MKTLSSKPETMNDKFKKSQILMLSLLAALLLITPLLSSSLRPTYLYFIINLLIVALGAEAGLLSVFSKPPEEKKAYPSAVSVPAKPVMVSTQEGSSEASDSSYNNNNKKVVISASPGSEKKGTTTTRVIEKYASEKSASWVVKVVDNNDDKVKKCPSMPSLFFIGSGETEQEDDQFESPPPSPPSPQVAAEEAEEVLAGKVLSGQELYTKAENFIGNFYKELEMQREESWNKIHGFYQKAF